MASSSRGAEVRSSLHAGWLTWLVCALLCTVWCALALVPVLRWQGQTTFLGLDGALSFLEEKTIDARLVFRGPMESPVKVCYVNVDSDSIAAIGNFPWNRAIFARTLDALFERGKVRAVGMDFVFSKAGLPQLGREEAALGSEALGRSIQTNRNVVVAATYGTKLGEIGKANKSFPFLFDHRSSAENTDLPELPAFPVVGPAWGHVGLIDTAGPQLRWLPAFARLEYTTYYAMAIQLMLLYQGLDESALEISGDRLLIRGSDSKVLHSLPLHLGQILEPNWFSPWDSKLNPSAGLAWVLEFDRQAREGTDEEKATAARFFENFHDAVVLIGPTDPLLGDNSPAPMSGAGSVPRVSIHGNLFKTIAANAFPIRPPAWAGALIITGLGLGVAFLSVLRNQFAVPGKIAAFFACAGYVAAAFFLFSRAQILLPLIAPLGAAMSCTFLAVLRQLTIEDRQRRRIKELFGSYVSAAVVNEMIEKNLPPRTGGAEVEITAFFSDIVSFSPLAEQLSAADLVRLMCQYLGECTGAVIEEEGTLDKYVGDAIIAMFGAPLLCRDHAAAACRAALGVQAAQARLREIWARDGGWPAPALAMQTRVGLHTGSAVVGNIGSELRFNYTMMGDTVNLAQRVEAAASHYGVGILASGDTFAAASREAPSLVFLHVDRVLVAGRSHPVELYELQGSGDECRRANEKASTLYSAARTLYTQGRWNEAHEGFLAAAAEDPRMALGAKKCPASVMAARCVRFASRTPEENLAFPLGKEANSI